MSRISGLMTAGKLDERIRLETLTTAGNGYGEPVETWHTLDEVWAEVDTKAGSQAHFRDETFRADQFDAERPIVFRLRHRSDIDPATVRIAYGGHTYDIRSVVEIGRRVGLEVYAVAHVA